MSNPKGLVIAFDGPDGVGKSTQLELTAAWLRNRGYSVYTARKNGGTPIGEELRKAMLSDNPRPPETDIYISLAMAKALAEEIAAHVEKGDACLIDRSPLAIVAYNMYGSQIEDRAWAYEAATQEFEWWQLDALLYFDAAQEVITERLKARTTKPVDYFEGQDADYHQRVREGYKAGLAYLKDNPELVKHVAIIDATPDIKAVQNSVEKVLEPLFRR